MVRHLWSRASAQVCGVAFVRPSWRQHRANHRQKATTTGGGRFMVRHLWSCASWSVRRRGLRVVHPGRARCEGGVGVRRCGLRSDELERLERTRPLFEGEGDHGTRALSFRHWPRARRCAYACAARRPGSAAVTHRVAPCAAAKYPCGRPRPRSRRRKNSPQNGETLA